MKRFICAIALMLLGAPAYAAIDTVPNPDHDAMLKSDNPVLARNKRLAYDMWRTLLEARQLDRAGEFMKEDYIQHNPQAETGMAGFKAFFEKLGPPLELKERVQFPLVAILAEGDLVVMVFARRMENKEDPSKSYTTTWFDMFRIEDGKVAEHWDPATRP